MKDFNRFLNEVKRLNITAVEYKYLDGAQWIPTIKHPNLPNNLKKSYWWELAPLNENELKEIQSNAINEVMSWETEQLQRCLKRLEIIKSFSVFYDFIKGFAPKFYEGKHNGIDVSDFQLKLEGCFTVNVPEKGSFDIKFLNDLQEQIFIKHAYLDGLKHQIEQLLPQQPSRKKKIHKDVTYEQLFKNNTKATLTLNKFKEAFPGILAEDDSYIGKGKKGYFPLFIMTLETLGYINKHSDTVYKNALNKRISNLNLSDDASEFRKIYKRIKEDDRVDLKISLEQI